MTDTTAVRQQHATWLALVESGGPFLTLPVLATALAQGLDPVRRPEMDALRLAWLDWESEQHGADAGRAQGAWIQHVVRELLDWHDDADLSPPPGKWEHVESEFGATTSAAFTLQDPDAAAPLALGFTVPFGVSLTARSTDGWSASPLDRVAVTLREHDIPLGILTDGRWWGLVWAPRGGATAHALWDSVLWIEDRVTLEAFTTLLGRRRSIGVARANTLLGMLEASLDSQEEVTDQLGRQVRAAVETLVDSIGRADERSRSAGTGSGRYLDGVPAEDVYQAAVSVLMRLVFMLAAEERRLLPADDPVYASSYGVATLGVELDRLAADEGEDSLEHSLGAWHRLLAAFRVVHDGAEHHEFRLPGYGGGLFDPDKHGWLEGRTPGGTLAPLPVDDRTVRRVIRSLMWLEFREKGIRESRRVTYRALDVEQIGYVYEGLLDHSAVRGESWILGFAGPNEPEISLDELGSQTVARGAEVSDWLGKQIGKPTKWVEQRLGSSSDPTLRDALWRGLLAATDNDERQASRMLPFAQLLRSDQRDLPVVIPPGRLYVTSSTARSDTETHYTPRSLAEAVVAKALEPLVYSPGPLQTLDGPWSIVPPDKILSLRVADIAMGSGAFLVAACRFLADALIQSVLQSDPDALSPEPATLWLLLQEQANHVDTAGDDANEAVIFARRLIADSCLFGSDINGLAVEMAKLSLWLITSAPSRPFTFLDHRLVAGDALLGVHSLDQIESLHLVPAKGRRLHRGALRDETAVARDALAGAAAVRSALTTRPTQDLRDVEVKQQLLARADAASADVALLADAVCAAALSSADLTTAQADGRFVDIAMRVTPLLGDPDDSRRKPVTELVADWLSHGRPAGVPARTPLHWVVRYPEVFADSRDAGFDAIIGNPPFLGGKKLSGALGTVYRQHLIRYIAEGKKGNADLVAFFLLRAQMLLRRGGCTGLIATNTVAQGDTRDVGLQQLLDRGVTVYGAVKSEPWPSKSANLEYSVIHTVDVADATAVPRTLDGEPVRGISSSLDAEGRVRGRPLQLAANANRAYMGTNINGAGFILSAKERQELLAAEPEAAKVLAAFIGGDDLNKAVGDDPTRWVIDFRDLTLEAAEQYPRTLEIARSRVKPHRDSLPDSKRRVRDQWWLHEARATNLYKALGKQERALVMAQTSNTAKAVWRTSTGRLFGHTTVVFAPADDELFGIINSDLHYWWMARYGPTMRTDLRYVPSDVFETFPFPAPCPRIADAGKALDEYRTQLMVYENEGLTRLYGRMHDPSEAGRSIALLRDAHAALDTTVCHAYGWSDIELEHGFHSSRRGPRWTFSTEARLELYDRLLELNHQRYAIEVGRPTGSASPRQVLSPYAATGGSTLFDQETP
jgi:hypothetical protein